MHIVQLRTQLKKIIQ